jgi:hypothetical protein
VAVSHRSRLTASLAFVRGRRPPAQVGVLKRGGWTLLAVFALTIRAVALRGQRPAPLASRSAPVTVPNIEIERHSLQVPIPDRVRLAVDVLVPKAHLVPGCLRC